MTLPQDILERYREHRKQDLKMCLLALETKDFMLLERVGHQLKGNGMTFGFSDLSEIGTKLEKAARQRNLEGLSNALLLLSQWLQRQVN